MHIFRVIARRVVPKGIRLMVWYVVHPAELWSACRAHWCQFCLGMKWAGVSWRLRLERALGLYPILIHVHNIGQLQYLQPIVEELRRRKAPICLYAAVDDPALLRSSELLKIPLHRRGLLSEWNRAGDLFAAFVSPTFWVTPPAETIIRICVFHGLPSKGNTFPPELVQRFSTLFLLGPTQEELYREFSATYPAIATKQRAYMVGYPKTDRLFQGVYDRETILASLGLDPLKPVVLFAPAFDPGTSLQSYGTALFDVLAGMEIQVLVKLHPACYDLRYKASRLDGVPWPDILGEYEKKSLIRHVGNKPLTPFLLASDVMLTDISGAALEFLLLDRPVVYLHCPDFFEKAISQNKHQYPRSKNDVLNDVRADSGRSTGVVAMNLEELPSVIMKSIRNPGEFADKRASLRQRLVYNPGNASEMAVATLMEVLGQNRKTQIWLRWNQLHSQTMGRPNEINTI